MKFIALIRKEMREILPWTLLATIAFAAISIFVMKMEMINSGSNWNHDQIKPGEPVSNYVLFEYSVLTIQGAWLFAVSLAMGIVLAIRQFWIPFFTKTWQFEIHRSVKRVTILRAKILTAISGIIIPLGSIWTALYLYACKPGVFTFPPSFRNYIEGWIFITMGLLIYFAISLTALTRARWYTTKITGPLFATFIITITMSCITLNWAFAYMTIGIIMLLSQVAHTFLNREF